MTAGLPKNSLYIWAPVECPFFGSRSGKNCEEGKNMLAQLKRLLFDESGQGMVEYGLILALIAIVVIGALVVLGPKIADIFRSIGDEIDGISGT
jgi:pilus assembly protein Flp/PilA